VARRPAFTVQAASRYIGRPATAKGRLGVADKTRNSAFPRPMTGGAICIIPIVPPIPSRRKSAVEMAFHLCYPASVASRSGVASAAAHREILVLRGSALCT